MGFIPFLGLWIRFFFVYKLNWKRMDIAVRTDKDLEKYENVKVGWVGLGVLFMICVLYYELTN
jgi:hypothetical protein